MSDLEVNLGFDIDEFTDGDDTQRELCRDFFSEMDGEVYGMVTDWLMTNWEKYKNKYGGNNE